MLGGLPFDVVLKASTAAMAAAFALIILAGHRRRPAPLYLAAFFLLLAGNFAAETLRGLAADPAERLQWYRLAVVFAALDPAVLYYFFSLHPARNALNAKGRVAMVWGTGALLAVSAPWRALHAYDEPLQGLAEIIMRTYTGAVYGVILLHVLQASVARPDEPGRRLLVAGMILVAFPRLGQVPADLFAEAWRRTGSMGDGVVHIAGALLPPTLLVLVAATWKAASDAPPGLRTFVGRWALAGAALAVVISGASLPNLVTHIGLAPSGWTDAAKLDVIGRAGAALRWLLFGAIVSVALLRHELLGMTLRHRRRGARMVVGLAFLGATAAALTGAQVLLGAVPSMTPTTAAALLVAVVVSQRFQGLVDGVASRLYGVPMAGGGADALDAYRRALVQATREGRNPAADHDLARLREELGVAQEVASALASMADGDGQGPLAVGRHLGGRYRVMRLVGRGSGGRVFLARDEMMQREVVLKEVPGEGSGGIPEEVRLARAIHHPHVVRCLDVVERNGDAVMVMELVPGGTLEDQLQARGPMSPSASAALADGVLAGLAALHAGGIVHCDLKPANVLLGADGAPKIADFGIARLRRGTTMAFDEPAVVRGTPGYMAPEQLAGALPTPAADIYAVGKLLQRCCGALPPALARVAERATATDPAARWPSAEAMRTALREASASLQVEDGGLALQATARVHADAPASRATPAPEPTSGDEPSPARSHSSRLLGP